MQTAEATRGAADTELRDRLVQFWRAFRSDQERWARGMVADEAGSYGVGLAFPPRRVAYELIPLFVEWVLRLLRDGPIPATDGPRRQAEALELVNEICPDAEYAALTAWLENPENRKRVYRRYRGRLYRRSRRPAGRPLFGLWEVMTQRAWDLARRAMAKYEACAGCREYDSTSEESPVTNALRLLSAHQPVKEKLENQILAAVELEPATRPVVERPSAPEPRRGARSRAVRRSEVSEQLRKTRQLVKTMASEGPITHREICARLGTHPRPPHAAWRELLSWPEAYRKHPGAVTKWLSEAIHR